MNERIKELAGEARIKFSAHWAHQGVDTAVITMLDLKEFAELIVRECAELIDNKVMITAAETYDEVFVAKFDTKELCAKQIREHFGVEE
jgi:hypothetical protein